MKRFQTRLILLLACACLTVGILHITALAASPNLTFGDAWRNTRTEAQVEFTSDTAGTYYYAVTDPSVSMETPSIDTSGPGTPCGANETVTVTVEDVPSTNQCVFWLVVKAEDGTLSGTTRTMIPEWDWWLLDEDWILHIESDKGLSNWNDWLSTQGSYAQMWYQTQIVGAHLWKDVTQVDGASFPAGDYPKLAAYTVEDGSTAYRAQDGVLYSADMTELVAYPGGKADTAFAVPDSVVHVESKAFYGNTKLKNITCDEVVVWPQAFANSAIETFSATGIIRINEMAFYGCTRLTSVRYTGELFYNFSVGDSAFQGCSALTRFPFDRIASAGSAAFRSCSALTKVEFPAEISDFMFAGCTGLTEITIPSAVAKIGKNAFDGCTNLVSVDFESATPPQIGGVGNSSPFRPAAASFRIHVPEGSENAYIDALGADLELYILPADTVFYPLYVNGERVRSNKLEIACGSGTAVFDPDSSTLTLTNATITDCGGDYGYKGAINSGLPDLTIVLVGDNTIDASGDSIDTAMDCDLVITGSGTLTTNNQLDLGREPSAAYDGSNDTGDLTIDGATVNVGSYLFVHHNITFENGAKVTVAGRITANHQSTLTVDGVGTTVTAEALSMGNGTLAGQTESRLVVNGGSLTFRDGVSFINPEDGDTNKYAIHFDPKDQGKIELNGGTFQTQSSCAVTNALEGNIAVGVAVDVKAGSWDGGNLLVSKHTGTLVPGAAATCKQDGVKSYYVCSDCGQWFEDAGCTVLITDKAAWTIPATFEHTGGAWEHDGAGHWQVCTSCGEKIHAAAHIFGDWKVTKEATASEKGNKERVCTACGYTETAEIPATETKPSKPSDSSEPSTPSDTAGKDNPKTGDGNGLVLWAILLLLSGGALSAAAYKKKRQVD